MEKVKRWIITDLPKAKCLTCILQEEFAGEESGATFLISSWKWNIVGGADMLVAIITWNIQVQLHNCS